MKLLVLLTLVGFCTCQAAVSAKQQNHTLCHQHDFSIRLPANRTTDGLHVHLQIR